jgi:hypothetical protein
MLSTLLAALLAVFSGLGSVGTALGLNAAPPAAVSSAAATPDTLKAHPI